MNYSYKIMKREVVISLATFILVWWLMGWVAMYAYAIEPIIISVDNPSLQEGARFGMGLSAIDDIDGDGVDDLVVGAPGVDKVWLISGNDQTTIRVIDDPDDLSGYNFGFSVKGVGDIDNDGFEDVAVGAPAGGDGLGVPTPLCNIPGSEWYGHPLCDAPFGRAFLFSGNTGDLLLRFDSYRSLFGYAIEALGDVNADGIPDIAVGAPFLWPNLGGIYAFSGEDGSLLWESIEPEPSWRVTQPLASFGMFMAGIDDITGDGIRDLLVSAPFHSYGSDQNDSQAGGKAFILSGYDGDIFRSHDNPTPTNNDFFSAGPGAVGDQDDDGIVDYSFSEPRSGLVHLYSGATGNPISNILNPGVGNPDLFGFQIARAGDKDGDGVEDFWIAAPDDGFLYEPDGGTVYLMNAASETLIQIEDPTPGVQGDEGGFGWQMVPTGDLNDDGSNDLMIGKPTESVGDYNDAGVVYLVLGVFVNHSPVSNAGEDKDVIAGADCMATVTLDGSGSTDQDGDTLTFRWIWDNAEFSGINPTIQLPEGIHTISLIVNDGIIDSDPDSVTINVRDETPPQISVSVIPDILWPPNHKMVLCIPTVIATDNCSPNPYIGELSITMNEGDENDYNISGDGDIYLRCERSKLNRSRIYTLTYSATDGAGNMATNSCTVTVPHDMRNK